MFSKQILDVRVRAIPLTYADYFWKGVLDIQHFTVIGVLSYYSEALADGNSTNLVIIRLIEIEMGHMIRVWKYISKIPNEVRRDILVKQ